MGKKNAVNSVQLTEAYVGGKGLRNFDQYTISEAILYFTGCSYVAVDDIEKQHFMNYIGSEMYEYYRSGKLTVRFSHTVKLPKTSLFGGDVDIVSLLGCDYEIDMDYISEEEFKKSLNKVSRRDLVDFADFIGVRPLFLFGHSKPKKRPYDNSNREAKCTKDKKALFNNIQKCLNDLSPLWIERNFPGGKINCSALVRKVEEEYSLSGYGEDGVRSRILPKAIKEEKIKLPKGIFYLE